MAAPAITKWLLQHKRDKEQAAEGGYLENTAHLSNKGQNTQK